MPNEKRAIRSRLDFSKIPTATQIPNLIEVQRRSYERFLQMDKLPNERDDSGLQSVFVSVFPITDFRGISQLDFVDYSIGNWECKCGHLKGLHHLRSTCTQCGATIKTDPYLAGDVLELEMRPTSKLLILPGLRLDYFSDISQLTVGPRLTMRYQLREVLAFKAGVGLFYQEPAFDQVDRNFGNPALKAERAIHYSAGVEWQPREHLTLDVTGFYKDFGNMVSPTTATVERDGVLTELRYDNNGVGRAYGAEVVARYQSSKLTAWLAYTLSRSERRDSGSRADRLFNFDQPHILTAFGTYRLPHDWEIGGRFRLISGSPTTPITGSVYSAIADRYYPVFGPKYSERMPLFAQLDLRVDKRWIFKRWILDTYIDVQNVLNRANPEAIQYNFDFTKRQVRQGLPVYPIIGIRGEF